VLSTTDPAVSSLPDNNNERIYFPELDGLRFFAFLLVFIHHQDLFLSIPLFSALKAYGWVGVDLFFALSAFLFTKLLIAEYGRTRSINFKKFYLRRVFRIWPLYFIFIGISILIFLFIRHNTISNYIIIRIVGLFAFSDNIMTAIYGYHSIPYSVHLWTIAYEEQFYIFIPIIILFLVRSSSRTKKLSFILVFVFFSLIRLVFITEKIHHPVIWVLPITHFESIIFGMVIGFGGFDFLLKRIKPLLLGLFGVLFFVLLCFLPNVGNISYWLVLTYSFVGISTTLVLFAVSNSNLLKKVLSGKLFVFLGKRSYGLYVYHLLGNGVAAYLVQKLQFIPSGSLASFLYSLALTIILSIISYKIIETPFLKLKRRFEVVISRPI
jgi:peptidoglycan/LPS O-acetylase OafA/YrhL